MAKTLSMKWTDREFFDVLDPPTLPFGVGETLAILLTCADSPAQTIRGRNLEAWLAPDQDSNPTVHWTGSSFGFDGDTAFRLSIVTADTQDVEAGDGQWLEIWDVDADAIIAAAWVDLHGSSRFNGPDVPNNGRLPLAKGGTFNDLSSGMGFLRVLVAGDKVVLDPNQGIWYSGSGAPSSGTGLDGDFYLRTSNSDVYKKASGAWSVLLNIQGAAGANGSNGASGTNGATWYSGSGAPSNGTGADGDFYLRTSNSDVYKKASGAWSVLLNIQGAAGANGSNGANGAIWYSGNGAPSSGLGANGDCYLRTDTSQIYQKSAGSWTAVLYIGGPQGPQGNQGAQGYSVLHGSGAPSSGTGVDGDFYIDTSAWTIYGPKASGAWGSSTNIASSSAVLSGSGAPSSGLGVDGDFYIDTSAWNIYGPKASGAWGSANSLVGPQGAQGNPGPDTYSAGNPSDWGGAGAPATFTAAVDRIAAAVAGLLGNPIP